MHGWFIHVTYIMHNSDCEVCIYIDPLLGTYVYILILYYSASTVYCESATPEY